VKILDLHRWDVTPAEARQIQLELRERIVLTNQLSRVRRVAGADVAFDLKRGRAIAGVVVYSFPDLAEIERASAVRRLTFPYVPGLLTFREAPALLAAFERVRKEPDVVFIDGQGYAHPRRFGIACHLGVLLQKPMVGCAKSRLIGTHADPPQRAPAWVRLLDDGETIGAVVRTRTAVNPVYVSQGHRVSLALAVKLALAVCDGYRIPKPTREADHFVGALKRSMAA